MNRRTRLNHLASDRGVLGPAEQSVSIIASPRTAIDPEAITVAEPHVHLVHPSHFQALAADTQGAWDELITGCVGHAGLDLEGLGSPDACLPQGSADWSQTAGWSAIRKQVWTRPALLGTFRPRGGTGWVDRQSIVCRAPVGWYLRPTPHDQRCAIPMPGGIAPSASERLFQQVAHGESWRLKSHRKDRLGARAEVVQSSPRKLDWH